jgi:hypothetical protein
MSGDFGGQVVCMTLPVICRGMLGKFALPEPKEEKFDDLQAVRRVMAPLFMVDSVTNFLSFPS